jgi:hypothetical protein
VACPLALTRAPRRLQRYSINQVLEGLELGDKFVKGSLSAWSCACPAAMPRVAAERGAARRNAPGGACGYGAARQLAGREKASWACLHKLRFANSRAPRAGSGPPLGVTPRRAAAWWRARVRGALARAAAACTPGRVRVSRAPRALIFVRTLRASWRRSPVRGTDARRATRHLAAGGARQARGRGQEAVRQHRP